jgi:hypothetical protein
MPRCNEVVKPNALGPVVARTDQNTFIEMHWKSAKCAFNLFGWYDSSEPLKVLRMLKGSGARQGVFCKLLTRISVRLLLVNTHD